MGGAVAIKAVGHPSVTEVLGLAPWIPHWLDLSPLDGRKLVVFPRKPRPLHPGNPRREPEQLARGLRATPRRHDDTYARADIARPDGSGSHAMLA
jgi:hypothetical protein